MTTAKLKQFVKNLLSL